MTSVDIGKFILSEGLSGSSSEVALVNIIQEELAELLKQSAFSKDICSELTQSHAVAELKDITLKAVPTASVNSYGKQIAQIIFDRLFANY